MKKYTYYLVKKDNFLKDVERWDIIKGHWMYSLPLHQTDNSMVYVLGGYAIGLKATKQAIKDGDIQKISRKEAIKRLLWVVR